MSSVYREVVAGALGFPGVTEVRAVVTDDVTEGPIGGLPTTALGQLPGDGSDDIYPTTADSLAFWLYTSGIYRYAQGRDTPDWSVWSVCETDGTQVLGITLDDWCLSAANADFHAGGSAQLSGEFVADGASGPPGDGGVCGQVCLAEHR